MAFFGNPAKAAQGYLNQIPQLTHETYDPYIQQGQQAEQGLPDFYHMLMNDPQGYYNKMLSGYHPSTGYDYESKKLLQGAQNAAAAGGYGGTSFDIAGQNELNQALLGKDMQQYYQNVMGLQNQGLEGLQGLGNRGYESTNREFDALGNNLGSQATLAYQGQANQNNQWAQLLSALLGGGAQGLGTYYGLKSLGNDSDLGAQQLR